ncbi:MAG: hypothetical protein ABR562_03715 [Thermoplasmatota archaeon]
MSRLWAAKVKAVQAALVAAIQAEYAANKASYPAAMQAAFECVQGIGAENLRAMPFVARVLGPGRSAFSGDASGAYEGTMALPVVVSAKGLTEDQWVEALSELWGLVVDALTTDPTLGGLVAGSADPAFELDDPGEDGDVVAQTVTLRLITRVQ